MKKFYVILCSLAMSIVTFIATAQTPAEEKQYAHDVGFNTTFLFTGILNAGQTPFSLMYKKYKDNANPLRLGVNTSINITSNSRSGTNSYSNSSSFSFGAVVGKEFQKPINSNWVWYFGGDITPSYGSYRVEQFSSGIHTYTTSNKYVGLAFRPFLGVRFNINKRLYISTEFSFGPSYSYRWFLDKQENPEFIQYDAQGGNFNFSMSPAYGLFLYYRF